MPNGRRTTKIEREISQEELKSELVRVKRKFNRFRAHVVSAVPVIDVDEYDHLLQVLRGPQFDPEKI